MRGALVVQQATLRATLQKLLIERSGIRRPDRKTEKARALDRAIRDTQATIRANAEAIRAQGR